MSDMKMFFFITDYFGHDSIVICGTNVPEVLVSSATASEPFRMSVGQDDDDADDVVEDDEADALDDSVQAFKSIDSL